MKDRQVLHTIRAMETSDGAGVRLKRALGQNPAVRLDPFLMLDAFSSDNPDDYIAGFPPHPHRGFETVTYLVEGHMRHRDHLGNEGDLQQGGVQWMTAGRGIIHEEMPQQEDGLLRGFQLWINLPAAEKMKPAGYRDIHDREIPRLDLATGGQIKAIAGKVDLAGESLTAPVHGGSTDPLYLDVILRPGESVAVPLTPGYNAFLYLFEGAVTVAEDTVSVDHVAVLTDGDRVTLVAGRDGARLLLLTGRPLGEPVAQYGPFVMNTQEELEQALQDYRNGTLTEPA
ncbi:Pirin-like protein [Alloalcanivorax dieselolei B5]|uniref:Pirin-like protein n=1 Tax=Alcanivorax dieselolei (strain DSM 16502 / CGMCC 1.3690 / MCCC 1A00001 / B-5) TaxID=930169 RepID=K0C7B1_ALCDB|nr:pirin family protein [Alloalcanivorax dieselolei]AFT68375.1 Pirin-like protein [Alloalcanivorax dieselolei B5]GGJ80725.1 putative quercetin 2,3-dioxygenase [Alloalcanivorax dieselolei]